MSSQSFFCDISSSYLHPQHTPPPTHPPCPAGLLILVPRPRFHLPPLSIQNSVPGREAINLLQRDDGAGEWRGCSRLPAVLTPTEHDTTRWGGGGAKTGRRRGRACRRRAQEAISEIRRTPGKVAASTPAAACQAEVQRQPRLPFHSLLLWDSGDGVKQLLIISLFRCGPSNASRDRT